MAVLLKQGLDDYFVTEYGCQRMPHAFARLYLAVPDRRPEVVRFVRSDEVRSYRVPCGIQPPTTAPTVANGGATYTLVDGKELQTTLTVSDVSNGDAVSFKVNDSLTGEATVSVTAGAEDTNTTVAAAIVADITGTTGYADFPYTASSSGAVVTITANNRNGNNQVPFVVGTITATGCTVTKEVVATASGLVAGQKVRFAYQFHSTTRGVWSELSPWSKLHTVTDRQIKISGFEAPRDGRVNPGYANAFDIDQIWLYAAFETSNGFCDVASMVKDKHDKTSVANWDVAVYFDMAEDLLVNGTPAPAVGIHEIPPAVKTIARHGNRLLMAGQLQRRFGSSRFPAHDGSETAWVSNTTCTVTPNQKYRVNEDDLTLRRALCRITGSFIDDSYIGYDLYCKDRYIGTVMDIVQSTNPSSEAVIPFENNPPYECSFYLWNDWQGEDLTAGTTDFYFVGHPNRIWFGGYDSEQSVDGTPTVRPETVHPLAYVELDPGEDNAIQDIISAGDNLSYVLCKRGVWVVVGGEDPGPIPTVQIRKLDGIVGEVAPRSGMLLSNGGIQFISKDGIYEANTSGIKKVSAHTHRMFAGAHNREGNTDEFTIAAAFLDDIASALVRGEDSPMAVHAGFSRGVEGDHRSCFMTQDLQTGSFMEHDRVEVTSNILGDAHGIYPPLCGDRFGRIKEILSPAVYTDLTRDADAPATLPAYTCRWQSAPFSFDGMEHKATHAHVVLKARSTMDLYLFVRMGYSLASPIPASYAAATDEEVGATGWRYDGLTGNYINERVRVQAGDENFRIALPQCAGKEAVLELRWSSNAGPLEISRVEVWGD